MILWKRNTIYSLKLADSQNNDDGLLDLVRQFSECNECSSLTEESRKRWNRRATQEQRSIIYRRDNGGCHYCHVTVDFDWFHADHVIPWSRCYKTDINNLVTACYKCNIAKDTLSKERYMELLATKGLVWRDQKYYMTRMQREIKAAASNKLDLLVPASY